MAKPDDTQAFSKQDIADARQPIRQRNTRPPSTTPVLVTSLIVTGLMGLAVIFAAVVVALHGF